MSYITVVLDSTHEKEKFRCNKELLDNYFWFQAKQDIKRKLSVCFVLKDSESNKIAGFYTLSSNSISNKLIPESFQKKLPQSYQAIPCILLGRLAIDIHFQGKGFGKILIIDALKRCFETSESIGAYAIIVDPLDKEAEKFYEKYGFIMLADSGKMFIAMKTVKELFT